MKAEEDEMQEFEIIYELLKNNPKDYRGYQKLGYFYSKKNINQAFLCYEQAWGLCNDPLEKAVLEELMATCRENPYYQVHSVSFVILSYNAKDIMVDCLESIRSGCIAGSYEIVVVDNASQDGIRDYLTEQKDIILQLNDHNTSFAEGCNQGIKLANPYNDIFLLNNDTIVPPLALFYMRLCLYEAEDIASVGPTSNMVLSWQMAEGHYQTKEEWMENAGNIHLPSLNAGENKVWLSGFALLIRRKAYDYVGSLDERFIRGNYEDTDYGIRLLRAGYRNVLCHNAFIFHYGSVGMKKDITAYNQSLYENEQRLGKKLGFNFKQYMACNREMVSMMNVAPNDDFSVLEVGSGFGLTLSHIQYLYPHANVAGIEDNIEIAQMGKQVSNIICANIETDILPYEKGTFDYILLPDVMNRFENAPNVIAKLKEYLKEGGIIVLLTRNLLYAERFLGVLKGKFESIRDKDARIRHFYTVNEIKNLLQNTGLRIQLLLRMVVNDLNVSEEDRKILETVKALPGVTIGEDYTTISYIITAVLP